MAKRLKTVTAGRLVVAVLYSTPTPRSTPEERAALREISSAAQMAMNNRRAWQRLELLLASNFTRRDLVVELTYDDAHLPSSRPEAVKLVRKFLTWLRAHRKARDQELRYVYITEQLSAEGGRLHHHLVINGTGSADLEVLRSLWPYGNIKLEQMDDWQGYEALAKYLTKEPREVGRPEPGKKCWVGSKNLKKPVAESEMVKDTLTLAAPPGAIILSAPPPIRNQFGEFATIKYIKPKSRKEKRGARPPSKRKKE